MPVVRQYPVGEVTPEGLPNAMPSVPAANDVGLFGGNQAKDMQVAGAELQRTSDTTGDMAQSAFKDANDTRIQDLNNQYISGAQQILHTGADAYSKLQGEDAIKAAPAYQQRLQQLRDTLLAQTANSYQKSRLGPVLDAHVTSANDWINGHVDQQQQVYDKNVALGAVDASKVEAVTNPANLDAAVGRAQDAMRSFYKGQAPEFVEAQARKAGSDVISGLIKDRLVRNDPSAVSMFQAYQDRLDPSDRIALGEAVRTLSTTVTADQWVRERGAGPTSEQARAGTKTSMSFWTSDGYSAPIAAGITAGFLRESQFDASARNPRDGSDGSDSISIGQWNGARAAAYQQFAASNKLDPRDPKTGLAYAKAEIDGVIPYSVSGLSPDFKARLMAAKTEKEAADLMTREYFRPRYTAGESAIRQGSASAILAEYGGPASGASASAPTGDQALDAVNASTGMGTTGPAAAAASAPPPASALSQEGVVDYRRQLIDIEQKRASLTAQNEVEFGNNPVQKRANQLAIEADYTRAKAAVQLGKDKLYADLQDYMAKGGPNGSPAVTMPPATIMSQLTYEQQNSVERQINRNVAGHKTVTNQKVWYALHAGLTDGNANVRQMWADTNLMQFKEHLSDQDFQELAKLQASVRKGDDSNLTHVQTNNEMVNSALLQMGIDPTPRPDTSASGDPAKAAKLHRVFQDELTAFEAGKGKKATPQEAQKVLDGVVKTGVQGGWFSADKPVFLLEPGDVPTKDREQIIAAIRKAGGVPTDDRVLEVYRHKLVTDPTQTEIPRPAPAANVRAGVEPIGVGTAGMGGEAAPATRLASGPFPRPSLPLRAAPRVIDNPPDPEAIGGMSYPVGASELDHHDATVRALRLRLGLEVH